MSDIHLEVKDLSFSYRSDAGMVPILKDLNFTIQRGEMVAIQGPSGSGKSTLLYLLGGLLKPTKGTVRIDGQILEDLPSDELAHFRNERVGFVFQQFFLLARHNVLENVLLPARYSRAHEPTPDVIRTARRLIDQVGLSDRADHAPNQLSGGQQQRVAIARALLKGAPLLLADEPTGNLDSKTSQGVLELFRQLNHEGKTVILITHDANVARRCDRILHVQDGRIEREEVLREPAQAAPTATPSRPPKENETQFEREKRFLPALWKSTWDSLKKNSARTVLTMLGVSVGVAAILAMLTIGRFAKDKILQSYAELGVYTVMFYGYPNWNLSASEPVSVPFREFTWEKDLRPLKKIFPQVAALSPVVNSWVSEASFGGRTVTENMSLTGVNEWAQSISNRGLLVGRGISPYHVENRMSVCMIGTELVQKLFQNVNPIGEILNIKMNEGAFGCRVIAVLQPKSSNSQWRKPNLDIILPYTYLQGVIPNPWQRDINGAMLRLKPGTDIAQFSEALKTFFQKKYGKSGQFNADSDSNLISQMQKFLTLFTWLLASIALVTLIVGGMGITNMMLVSVTERYREIGLRKAVGATDRDIRFQFLAESVFVCTLAGVVGLVVGFGFYEGALWLASRFSPSIVFVWWVDSFALVTAMISIILVGLASGLFPALKAERLQVIEALRSE